MTPAMTEQKSPLRGSTASFVAVGLFLAIFVAWGAIGAGALPETAMTSMSYVAFLWHLTALLVVAAVAAPAWARAGGFGWALLDSATDILVINGVEQTLWWPIRLGAHIGLAVWMAGSSYVASGARRIVGYLAAATLAGYSLAAPYVPEPAIMPSMVLIMVWLVLTGRSLRREEATPAVARGVGAPSRTYP